MKILDYHDLFVPSRKHKFVLELGDSLQNLGFFAIKNHSLDSYLISEAYKQAEHFFNLPVDVKQRYYIEGSGGDRGYTPFGKESAKNQNIFDLKEFFHIGGDDRYHKNLWPKEVSGFQETFEIIFKKLEAIGQELLKACALYLNLPETRFSSLTEGGNTIIRVLHYPKITEYYPKNAVRAAAHEDINLITLLVNSTESGLQIKSHDGKWLDAPEDPSLIIVDSGDMLQNISNGIFKSTTHRVINSKNSSNKSRYSMPCFIHPRPEVDLSPIKESILAQGGKKLFPNITAQQYLNNRLKELGLLRQ